MHKFKNVFATLVKQGYLFYVNFFWAFYYQKKAEKRMRLKIKEFSERDNLNSSNRKSSRRVFLLPEDNNLSEAIITCYFSSKPDPQHGVVRSNPNINYIAPWYNSIIKQNIQGVILYDNLPSSFVKNYEKPNIRFRRAKLGEFSIFEERWFLYHSFLKDTRIKKVFFTDVNDVYINNNPFKVFNIKPGEVYVGRDREINIANSNWMNLEINQFFSDSGLRIPYGFYFMPLFNAGLLGGERTTMLFFISEMKKYFLKAPTPHHKDMTVLNLLIYKYLRPNLFLKGSDYNNKSNYLPKNLISGFPFNSGYKKYEFFSEACFVHK